MVTLKDKATRRLQRLIPEYLEVTAEFIKTGKRIPDNLNPIHILAKDIDIMDISKKEELAALIQYNIETLRHMIGDLAFYN